MKLVLMAWIMVFANGCWGADANASLDALLRESDAQSGNVRSESGRLERIREIDRARRAAREAERGAVANMGGQLDCGRVSSDYALSNYCRTGDCSGFSASFPLWQLCRNDDVSGMSGNYGVWSFLRTGDTSGFAQDHRTWERAKAQSGSFAERKRFVIYYLRGYTYGK